MLPLYELTKFNIEEARRLGLFSPDDNEAIRMYSDLSHLWENAPDDIEGFKRGINRLADYCDSMVWLEETGNHRLIIHRVITVENVKYPLMGTMDPIGSRIAPLLDELTQLLNEISKFDSVEPKNDGTEVSLKKRLEKTYRDLRSHLCYASSSGVAAKIHANALHCTWSNAWIAPDAHDLFQQANSQMLRDILGMINLPERSRASSLGQSLILMSFEVTISSNRLPRRYNPDFIKRNTTGLWLIRPTICHTPNERFVQRHSSDSMTSPIGKGMTINISSKRYDEGISEMILMHGESAELTWHDFKLLTPPPNFRNIDDDHAAFVNVVQGRHT